MPNFATLKKNISDVSRLVAEIEKANSGGFTQDERFWFPEQDKVGNAFAVIRFLPAPPVDGDDGLPRVSYKHYNFKGPTGKNYAERSRTTFKGEKDPVAELNSALYTSSEDENHPNRIQAKAQRQKLTYISNILVVTDKANPENEGKVFLFRYGPTINEMIEKLIHPEFEGDPVVNVFDPWNGRDFRLVIKKQGKFNNYDDSAFAQVSTSIGSDKDIERIWNEEYSLKAEVAPEKFKSYDELKAKLNDVLGVSNVPSEGVSWASGSKTAPVLSKNEPKPVTLDDLNLVEDEDDDDLKAYRDLVN